MLTHLRFTNFKCFGGEHRVPLAPLTFLVGANSSGKSTLLQSLLVMRQSWRERIDDLPLELRTDGKLCKLGSATNVVHRQEEALMELGLGFPGGELTFQYDATDERMKSEDGGLGLTGIVLGETPDAGLYVETKVSTPDGATEAGVVLRAVRVRDNGKEIELPVLPGRDDPGGEDEAPPERGVDYVLSEGTWGAREPSEAEALAVVERAVASHLKNGRQALNALSYVGPLRLSARRHFGLRPKARRVGADGEDFAAWLRNDADIRHRVNEMLDKLGMGYEVTVHNFGGTAPLGELQLREDRTGTTIGLPDVGCGVSQLLPVLTQLALLQPETSAEAFGPLLLIEQPEVHLHPAAQVAFGRLLGQEVARLAIRAKNPQGELEQSKADVDQRKRAQIIVETHSEHIINAVRWEVLRARVPAEDVLCLALHSEDGFPEVKEIPLDAEGNFLDHWPAGFFAVELGGD